MSEIKRVWSDKKTTWNNKEQVWDKDGELKVYDGQWKDVDGDVEVYKGSQFETLPGNAELDVYDTNDPTFIGTVEDGINAAYVFKDWDGTVLKTGKVKDGGTPTPPANPTRSGYAFTGWNPTVEPIYKSTEYIAQYELVASIEINEELSTTEVAVGETFQCYFTSTNAVTFSDSTMWLENTSLTVEGGYKVYSGTVIATGTYTLTITDNVVPGISDSIEVTCTAPIVHVQSISEPEHNLYNIQEGRDILISMGITPNPVTDCTLDITVYSDDSEVADVVISDTETGELTISATGQVGDDTTIHYYLNSNPSDIKNITVNVCARVAHYNLWDGYSTSYEGWDNLVPTNVGITPSGEVPCSAFWQNNANSYFTGSIFNGDGINTESFTLACWVKLNSLDQCVMMAIANTDPSEVGFFLKNTGYMTLFTGDDATEINTGFQPSTDTWYHMALTYQQAEGETYGDLKFYVNGQLEHTESNFSPSISTSTLNIGCGPRHNWGGVNGMMNETIIANLAYDATTIQNIWEYGQSSHTYIGNPSESSMELEVPEGGVLTFDYVTASGNTMADVLNLDENTDVTSSAISEDTPGTGLLAIDTVGAGVSPIEVYTQWYNEDEDYDNEHTLLSFTVEVTATEYEFTNSIVEHLGTCICFGNDASMNQVTVYADNNTVMVDPSGVFLDNRFNVEIDPDDYHNAWEYVFGSLDTTQLTTLMTYQAFDQTTWSALEDLYNNPSGSAAVDAQTALVDFLGGI